MENKPITIEETLRAADIPWSPFLVYSQILEGAREPLVFLDVCLEVFDLIGRDGSIFHFPTASQLTATSSSETQVVDSGAPCTEEDKTIGKVTVTVDTILWSSVKLSDILLEDYPSIDWVRLHFKNMGAAVMELLNSNVLGVLAAGFGVLSTCATLNYVAVSNAVAACENNQWIVDPNTPPFLIANPDACATMAQDTQFVETPRFYASDPTRLLGEMGMYAECRVLKSPLLNGTGNAYIVYPPNYKFGPSVAIVWKRRLRVKSEYHTCYEKTEYVTSIRAKSAVVQALGVCRINITTTP